MGEVVFKSTSFTQVEAGRAELALFGNKFGGVDRQETRIKLSQNAKKKLDRRELNQ